MFVARIVAIVFFLCFSIATFAQAQHAPIIVGPTMSVKSFIGRVVPSQRRGSGSVNGLTIKEFMVGGSQVLATTTTDSDGNFQLPTPEDASPRAIVVTDNDGHVFVVHIRLSANGGPLRIHFSVDENSNSHD